MTGWRNRIVAHGQEDPADLRENEHNWRLHSTAQRRAFEQVADEIGIIDDVIVNRRTSEEWGDQRGNATLVGLNHLVCRTDYAVEKRITVDCGCNLPARAR